MDLIKHVISKNVYHKHSIGPIYSSFKTALNCLYFVYCSLCYTLLYLFIYFSFLAKFRSNIILFKTFYLNILKEKVLQELKIELKVLRNRNLQDHRTNFQRRGEPSWRIEGVCK